MNTSLGAEPEDSLTILDYGKHIIDGQDRLVLEGNPSLTVVAADTAIISAKPQVPLPITGNVSDIVIGQAILGGESGPVCCLNRR